MYKGKIVVTIDIDINMPENIDGILPIDDIRENIVTIDQVFQKILDENILCPEDGITGRAILEEAYLEIVDEEDSCEEGEIS